MPPDLHHLSSTAGSVTAARKVAHLSGPAVGGDMTPNAETDETRRRKKQRQQQQQQQQGEENPNLVKKRKEHDDGNDDGDESNLDQLHRKKKQLQTPPPKSPKSAIPKSPKSKSPASKSKSRQQLLPPSSKPLSVRPTGSPAAALDDSPTAAEAQSNPGVVSLAGSLSPSPSPSVLVATPSDMHIMTHSSAKTLAQAADVAGPDQSPPAPGSAHVGPPRGRASLEVHKCQAIDWRPSAVTALAASCDSSVVAAARENGDIEIWRVAAGAVGWACELRIPGRRDAAISSLVWCLPPSYLPSPAAGTLPAGQTARGRLFSASLDGTITEWNLATLAPQAVADSMGGPVWAMAVEPNREQLRRSAAGGGRGGAENKEKRTRKEDDEEEEEEDEGEGGEGGESAQEGEEYVAVGCDDGALRLFVPSDRGAGMEYRKSFPRGQAKILCVAWASSGARRVFTGGSDSMVRCWDVAAGREVYRIPVATGMDSIRNLCVWSLLALSDGTLVTGDSSGHVRMWDGALGTYLSSIRAHKADVLALAAMPNDAKHVFSAGADGLVSQYRFVSNSTGPEARGKGEAAGQGPVGASAGGKWLLLGAHRSHTADARALAVALVPEEEEGGEEGEGGGEEEDDNVVHWREVLASKVKPGMTAEQQKQLESKVKGAWRRRKERRRQRKEQRQQERQRGLRPQAAMIVSGGNDARLVTYPSQYFLKYSPHTVCPTPQPPPTQMVKCALGGRLLLVQQALSLDVWWVDEEEGEEGGEVEWGAVGREGVVEGERDGKGKGKDGGEEERRESGKAGGSAVRRLEMNGVLEGEEEGEEDEEEEEEEGEGGEEEGGRGEGEVVEGNDGSREARIEPSQLRGKKRQKGRALGRAQVATKGEQPQQQGGASASGQMELTDAQRCTKRKLHAQQLHSKTRRIAQEAEGRRLLADIRRQEAAAYGSMGKTGFQAQGQLLGSVSVPTHSASAFGMTAKAAAAAALAAGIVPASPESAAAAAAAAAAAGASAAAASGAHPAPPPRPRAPPRLVAQLKTSGPGHIVCSAISPDGRQLALSDLSKLRVYNLLCDAPGGAGGGGGGGGGAGRGGRERAGVAAAAAAATAVGGAVWRIERAKGPSLGAAVCVAFAADGRTLMAASPTGEIAIVATGTSAAGLMGSPRSSGPSRKSKSPAQRKPPPSTSPSPLGASASASASPSPRATTPPFSAAAAAAAAGARSTPATFTIPLFSPISPKPGAFSAAAAAAAGLVRVVHRFAPFGLQGDGCSPASIRLLVTSPCGRWLAAADALGHAAVFDVKRMRKEWDVPPFSPPSLITALAFHPSSRLLMLASNTNSLRVFFLPSSVSSSSTPSKRDIRRDANLPPWLLSGTVATGAALLGQQQLSAAAADGAAAGDGAAADSAAAAAGSMSMSSSGGPVAFTETPWSVANEAALMQTLQLLPDGIRGISMSANPRSPIVILYSSRNLCVVDLSAWYSAEPCPFPAHQTRSPLRRALPAPRFVELEHRLLFLAHVGPTQLLAVERQWRHVLATLPPPVHRHKFGHGGGSEWAAAGWRMMVADDKGMMGGVGGPCEGCWSNRKETGKEDAGMLISAAALAHWIRLALGPALAGVVKAGRWRGVGLVRAWRGVRDR
ncbi:hypothetical protein CLOM_g1394 [Closterium sp. NIES-68]|nr:hypothetical protein CLOM_g1394 [Closterium sp. NIES-68]